MKYPTFLSFKSPFLRHGVPVFILCLGGSFGLKAFTSLRYEYSTKSTVSREQLEQEGIILKPPEEVTIEAQYEELKKMDIDNWENIRGPRPWEEETMINNKERPKK
ncbi:hypothetical protein HHI36_018013 [Cryptolaemus montrouzieri]|uniref:Cytochrome c oxidase assembly protein COX16 homolog, mitochondrial n=1 Tax=Cryptolaemus montrouzieri TaxID=559131 RepID=A0ABD2NYP3_9CUCU